MSVFKRSGRRGGANQNEKQDKPDAPLPKKMRTGIAGNASQKPPV